jgi:hypothetical protein
MKAIAMRTEIHAVMLLAAALMIMVGYGCGDDEDEIDVGFARIRAIHLSVGTPPVDIFVNGEEPAAVTNLAFGVSTPFITDVDPGTYTFNIAASPGTPAQSVLDVGPLALAGRTAYTAVAFDVLASINALPLVDDLSNPGAGNIRLRAIHVAPDVGEVDIYEVSDPQNPTLLYENVPFGAAGDYLPPLPAGSYAIGFDVNNDTVADLTFITPALAAGSILNVFAVSDGPADVFLIAQFQDGTTAEIPPQP